MYAKYSFELTTTGKGSQIIIIIPYSDADRTKEQYEVFGELDNLNSADILLTNPASFEQPRETKSFDDRRAFKGYAIVFFFFFLSGDDGFRFLPNGSARVGVAKDRNARDVVLGVLWRDDFITLGDAGTIFGPRRWIVTKLLFFKLFHCKTSNYLFFQRWTEYQNIVYTLWKSNLIIIFRLHTYSCIATVFHL